MGWINRQLHQQAVYWPPADVYGVPATDPYGRAYVGQPVQIVCRWEDSAEERLMPDGRVVKINAEVFCDRPLAIRGYLMQGSLNDLTPLDPSVTPGAYEIRDFNSTPSMGVNQYSHMATL